MVNIRRVSLDTKPNLLPEREVPLLPCNGNLAVNPRFFSLSLNYITALFSLYPTNFDMFYFHHNAFF